MSVATNHVFTVQLTTNCEITAKAIQKHLQRQFNGLLAKACGIELIYIKVTKEL